MGEIIEILEELPCDTFRIGFSVTGEERQVCLDPEKRELFRLQDIRIDRPMACPFLIKNSGETFVCSVHTSRPGLCRQYSCFRILVLDPQGNRIGRVTDNSRYFTTADASLHRIWNEQIAGVVIPSETDWDEFVKRTLASAGYQVL